MVYKRYIKKDGKSHGPYYYESYRDSSGKVVSRYLPDYNPKKKFSLKILTISFLVVIFVVLMLVLIAKMKYTGFSVSGNVDSNLESLQQQFSSKQSELQIKEPVNISGEILNKNKNKRMDFQIDGGNLRLYFDSLNYSDFVEESTKQLVESGKVNINEIIGNISENNSINNNETQNNSVSNETTNNQTTSNQTDNVTIETNKTIEDNKTSENNSNGLITGNFISDISNEENISNISVSDINLDVLRANINDLNKSDLENITEGSKISANDFDIVVNKEESGAITKDQSQPDYKWGYKVRLDDLDFMAKIDVTSDQQISVFNENTLAVGDNLLSFKDLINAGYKVRIEKPVLQNEIEKIAVNNTVNESINNNTEIVNGSNESIDSSNNNTDNINSNNNSDSNNVEQQTNQTITGNIVRGFVSIITQTVDSIIGNNFNVEDVKYNNTLTIYIERDFTNSSYKVGDIIELDPTLYIFIVKAKHLDENKTFIADVYDYVKDKDNNWTTIPNNDYVRVHFEKNLTNANDITIYARATNNESNGSQIGVYRKNSDEEIARFVNITNESWGKIYLTNLSDGESLDVFDLKSFGDVDYDYIVDPFSDNGSLQQTLYDCGTLNTTNAVYTLNQSINSTSTCINITANNITLNGNGYIINYSTTVDNKYGILSTANFTTIINATITNLKTSGSSDYAIYLSGANNGTIANNTIINNGGIGVGIYLSSKFDIITNNNITTTGTGAGIYLNTTTNSTLTGNAIKTSTGHGIALSTNSNSNNATSNNITTIGNAGDGFDVSVNSSLNTFANNNITTTATGVGIYLLSGSLSNNITNNNITAIGTGNAIHTSTSSNSNNITNNTITVYGTGNGIDLGSNSNNLANNNVTTFGSTSYALYFDAGSKNIVTNPTITTNSSNSFGIYLVGSNNNTITNGVINSTGADSIRFSDTSNYNNFTNISLLGTNTTFFNVKYLASDSLENRFIDMPNIRNYNLTGTGSIGVNLSVIKTNLGKIEFISRVNGTGSNFTNDIRIGNNSVAVNMSNNTGLNSSANITLYGIGNRGFTNASIFYNGTYLCNTGSSPSCYNFTSLTADTVLFNVSGWGNSGYGNYSIGSSASADTTAPNVSFVSPTPSNNSVINVSTLSINITAVDETALSTINITTYYSNGTLFNTTWGTTSPLFVNLTGLANGIYYFNASANDTSNNFNNTNTTMVNVSVVAVANTITSCPTSLTSANTTYTIANNLTSAGYCLNITANNITVNGNGYSINYSQSVSGEGIMITGNNTNISNVTIYQGSTSSSSQAIHLNPSQNSSISNVIINTIATNGFGIHLTNSVGTLINNTNITTFGTQGFAIYQVGSNLSNIMNLVISTNGSTGSGFEFDKSNLNVIANSTITNYGTYGYGVHLVTLASNNNFTNVIVTTNNTNAYALYSSSAGNNNRFTNATVKTTGNNGIGILVITTNNSIYNLGSINSTNADSINLATNSTNNNFTNITIISNNLFGLNLNGSINGGNAESNGTYLIDMPNIANYTFLDSTLKIKKTNLGEIFFTGVLNGTGTNLTKEVQILNNSAFVNLSINPNLNVSANITLNGIGNRGFTNPAILYNGVSVCNSTSSPSCNNFTSLTASTVIFNVSSWSNYSIGEDPFSLYFNETNCYNATVTNGVYTHQNNLNSSGTCINVLANNITINGNGYMINYSQSGNDKEYGVYSTVNLTTIKNTRLVEGKDAGDFDQAIYFNLTNNGIIQNNTITTFGTSYGVNLTSSPNSTLTNNNITTSGPQANGIYLDLSPNSTLTNNNITTSGSQSSGVFSSRSNSSNLTSNTITTSGVQGYGIYITSSNSTLTNNNITTYVDSSPGIYITSSSNSTLTNNTITTSGGESNGIFLTINSISNTLTNNTITTSGSSSEGIHISSSSNSTLTGNNIIGSGVSTIGIYITSGPNNLTSNTITSSVNNNYIGIDLGSTSTLTSNTITTSGGSSEGIDITSNYNNITNSTISSNGTTSYGIYLGGSNNSISNGTINVSRADSIRFNGASSYNNLTNVSIIGTNTSVFHINWIGSAGYHNGTQLIDMPNIAGYSFNGIGQKIIVRKTNLGEIKFLNYVNGTGTNFTNDIVIGNNSVSVNMTNNTGLNSSANITLYGIGNRGFTNATIFFNGTKVCDMTTSPSCYNFTNLTADTVLFNVSNWGNSQSGNYSIGEGSPIAVVITPFCGDGVINGLEQCDDGNTNGGDGCSETCQIEIPGCIPNWQCGQWTDCINGQKNRNCIDYGTCNFGSRQEFRECTVETPSPNNSGPGPLEPGKGFNGASCNDWSECKLNYSVYSVISGDINLTGEQDRLCDENGDGKINIVQKRWCDPKARVQIKPSQCPEGNQSLEIYDSNNNLVSRVGYSNKLNVDLPLDGTNYCSHCYDNVKNYGEDEVDCSYSGNICPVCKKEVVVKNNSDLWFLLVLLIICWYLIYDKRVDSF